MGTYWNDLADRPTCVYRAYIDDDLAYVGITRNPPGRFSKHLSLKSWWRQVDHIDLEWFDNRTQALAAERAAIHDEDPIYDVVRPRVGA
jgi:predicted GIY-YIG superfamily endonuclease